MGDLGKEITRRELEPIEEPFEVPAPIEEPAAPEREKVPA